MREPKLTEKQKERLRKLEPKLKNAIENRDFDSAISLTKDLQDLLKPTKNYNRLVQSKNRFYELAIDCDKIDLAINGLLSNREVVRKTTRLYLEATALLSIAYLRKNDVESAKPYIKEVLQNDDVIKTEKTRIAFNSEIVERFDQEIILASLKDISNDEFTRDEVESDVIRTIQSQNEDEIYENIGKLIPQKSKYLLFEVHDFSIKQLPSAERLALPSPDQKIKDAEIGKTTFQSIKRVIYNSLCNPSSDIYKSWFNNGMQVVLSKGYITTAVISCFAHLGIGIKSIIVWVAALVVKFGLEVYCDRYKPKDLMNLRD